MRTRKIEVEPVHGWGWFMPGRPSDYVPSDFEIRLDHLAADHWKGTVTTAGHEFERARVSLSQRHTEWDGCVNITIHLEGKEGVSLTGFASVPLSLKAG